jgi:hypothetical protein
VYPTAKTPWFKLVLQLEKTPDLYEDQFEASTAIETGYYVIAVFIESVVFPTFLYPEIFKAAGVVLALLHVWSLGTYG